MRCLGLGLNVVVGFAGLLDLGYIAFYAIGAYVTAYFTSKTAHSLARALHLEPVLRLPDRLVAASLAGVLLGGPTLRLRGDYLAIVTLGFGEIVQLLAKNAQGITNGPRGAFGVPQLSIHIGGFKYKWGLKSLPYYYLILGIIVLVMLAFSALNRSRTGRALAAIREDEVAAEAMGVPTLRYKLIAFAIGASVRDSPASSSRRSSSSTRRPSAPGLDPGTYRGHFRRHGLDLRCGARRGRVARFALQPAQTPYRPMTGTSTSAP